MIKNRLTSVLVVMFFMMPTNLFASSSGPNSPGTAADDSSIGTVTWSNPNNSKTQNNVYASTNLDTAGNGAITHYLKVTNFGFSIPAGATINGIVAEIDKYSTSPNTITDKAVRIVKGGSIGLTDRSDLNAWAGSDTNTYVTYGSSSDLWGTTWTVSDINASTFGVAISAQISCGLCSVGVGDDIFIDHIRMTVYYTAAAGASSATFLQFF